MTMSERRRRNTRWTQWAQVDLQAVEVLVGPVMAEVIWRQPEITGFGNPDFVEWLHDNKKISGISTNSKNPAILIYCTGKQTDQMGSWALLALWPTKSTVRAPRWSESKYQEWGRGIQPIPSPSLDDKIYNKEENKQVERVDANIHNINKPNIRGRKRMVIRRFIPRKCGYGGWWGCG